MNQAFSVAPATEAHTAVADPMTFAAATGLHARSCLKASNTVGGYPVFAFASKKFLPVGISPGQIEEVNSGEDHQEPAQQGYGIDRVRGVEASEQDERRTQGGSGESDVVQRIDATM